MDTKVHKQSLRRAALEEVEYWLMADFEKHPNLPIILVAPPGSQHKPIFDQVYRSMREYYFHLSLTTLECHLTIEELSDALIRVARIYSKVELTSTTTPPR